MISIIMPLYNAERFLEKTLQSIANQTYRDYELICIDDASSDLTAEIVKKAQLADKRIILLHNQERKGAAYSRNKAMRQARGDYLAFLDGDDIFDEKMLEKAYICAKENLLDIIIFEYKHVNSEEIYKKQYIYRNNQFKEKYCRHSFSMSSLKAEEYCIWSNSPWNKLFRTEFIMENGLEFQSLSSSNDVFFVEMAFLLAKRIMSLNDNSVMVYARDHDTPTRISTNRDPMCTYYACRKILEELSRRQLMKNLFEHCYLKCYFILLSGLSKAKSEKRKENFYHFLQQEGIDKLKEIGGYPLLTSQVKNVFDRFEENYNTKWFENENLVVYLVRNERGRFQKLFDDYHNIYIWGAGNYGRSLIVGLNDIGLEVRGIMDSNANLEGKPLANYNILDVQKVNFEIIDLMIVAARGAFNEVAQVLERYNVRVIDLSDFIGIC